MDILLSASLGGKEAKRSLSSVFSKFLNEMMNMMKDREENGKILFTMCQTECGSKHMKLKKSGSEYMSVPAFTEANKKAQ